MREGLVVLGLVAVLGLFALAALLDPVEVLAVGRALMLWSIAVAVPFELAYFGALALALRGRSPPRGWYWRSFEFHERLTPAERRWVLPWFFVGTLAMVASSFGIVVVVVGGVAALRGG